MKTFLYLETMNCEVTFVRRVTGDDATEALNAAWDGDGELLGISIGDSIAGFTNEQVLDDAPHNMPAALYPEASRT